MKHTKRCLCYLLLALTITGMMFHSLSGAYADDSKGSTKADNAVQWKHVVFGQSTNKTNTITEDKSKGTVTITAGSEDGKNTGGKITDSHDGIAYYYTEIDPSKNFDISADITVNYFAKPKSDKQEGFGIMARDAIGADGDTDAFASNMAMVGGYKGAIQSAFRNDVKDKSGADAAMEGIHQYAERPANNKGITYKMVMKKTNTGYQVNVDNGAETIYYKPKFLEVLNPDKIYVGFFAARVASITVSNISFKTSDAATDPAGKIEPNVPIKPSISLSSRRASSKAGYDLDLLANVNGSLRIKRNGEEIYNGTIAGGSAYVKHVTLAKGDNTFDVIYSPDKSENITSSDSITAKYVVLYKNYGREVYVSPNGRPNSDGSMNNPTDLYSAVNFASTGQKIYVHGGTYNMTAPLKIERGNNGTKNKPIYLEAVKGEKPVLDFTKAGGGFALAGNYWVINGISITKTPSTGFKISGNYNVAQNVCTYANGDTGFQISGSSSEKIDKWPSYNLVLNCESHDNVDVSENNADGFAAKITCGAGNVFRGCISYNNCDDGFDLYSKLETGPIGAVTIENCISYESGTLSDGTKTKGDGNGFKLGGEGLAVKHVLRNCLAFGNNTTGITSNSDPAITVENCTSVDNGLANFDFSFFKNSKPEFTAKNNISFRTVKGAADNITDALASGNNYFYDGTVSKNAGGVKVLPSDFKSIAKPSSYARNKYGTIKIGDFMVLAANSKIQAGAKLLDFSKITPIPNGIKLNTESPVVHLGYILGIAAALVVLSTVIYVYDRKKRKNKTA